MKGFIVCPEYKVINDKPYVLLYGRLENKESFLTINEFKPYFYIKESDLKKALKLEKFESEKTEFTNFKKEKVTKLILNLPSDVPKLRKTLEENDIECYEADIKFPYRFMFDLNLKGTIDIEGSHDKEEFIDRVYKNPEIKPVEFFPKLKILSLDIETSSDSKELYAISLYSENFNSSLIISEKKVKNAESFEEEAELLERFVKIVQEFDPDIITGWNLIDFDLNFLKKRFEQQEIPFTLGRTNEAGKLSIESDFFRTSKANIPGRQTLDALSLVKDPYLKDSPFMREKKFENYKLETVSNVLLGKSKLIDSSKNKGEEITRLFEKDKESLIKYNLNDAKLVYEILEETKLLDILIERSILTGMPLDRVNASIASMDSLYLREARKRKLVLPSNKFSNKENPITGGYVMASKPGIYDNILVFDFKSLYPSLMRTFNIDPASYLEKKEKNSIETPNKAYFKNEDGILPTILEKLTEARVKAKKENKQLTSQAIKITMNCFSPDTEILTENGTKNIKKVEIGEKVYSINPNDGKIELKPIVKKFSYPYKGKMIKIKSSVVDYLVTPNHRFLVQLKKDRSYEWKTAQELYDSKKEYWLPVHSKIKGKKISKIINLEKICRKYNINYRKKGEKLQKSRKHSSINVEYELEDWLSFLGWYISEGSVYTSKPKRYTNKVSWRGITRIITISQEIIPKRKKIIKLFEKMNLKHCIQSNGISVNNHIIAEILEKDVGIGTNSKRIPSWVYSLEPILLNYLFESMMEGDGDTKGDRYSTKSKYLAEDFMRLVQHLGWYSHITIDKNKYNGKEYLMYRVRVNKKKGIKPYIHPRRNMSLEEFEGDVICIEVKPYHTILAGRNYKLNFCGQSMFGSIASPASRFFNMQIANAITTSGQFIIKKTAEEIEKMGYEVIYEDTDSCFVNLKIDSSEKADKIGKEIEEKINSFYKKYIKENYNRDSKLELEFEKNYIRFLMPKLRGEEKGAKKRYAGLLKNNKIEVTGLEAVRSDWTEAAQMFQNELLDRIFHKKEVLEYVKTFVKDLEKGKYDNKLVYRKQIRKDLDEYIKISPPHVKAARKLKNFTGDIVEYYLTEDGPEPLQNLKHKIDYKHYIDKQIKPIADSILVFFNTNFEALISSTKQKSLFNY